MEHRIQRFLLGALLQGIVVTPGVVVTAAAYGQDASGVEASDLNQEVFELGVFTGILNIGDFGSEWAVGISANFQASEDFFLQYNYLQAEAELSSYEKSTVSYFSGSDRDFVHYDLLVGYNLFQGEMYPDLGAANLSSLYIIGGVGDTRFGDEANFTITYGVGYKVAFARKYVMHIDYRSYLYESSLVRDEEETTQSSMFGVGVNYLF